ncbi:MAG TPA: excalibur calcium-binding domain-containing protein [Sphingomonas sp.]|nr:excalibur calcium-binding domain-containing protein [Sphingomonas sp.]
MKRKPGWGAVVAAGAIMFLLGRNSGPATGNDAAPPPAQAETRPLAALPQPRIEAAGALDAQQPGPEPRAALGAAPAPSRDGVAADGEGGVVYYRNCSAARAAGAAPVHAGQPGYSRRLDRDGDGIGCE